ncbi:MAG TPA: hypothetical protein VJH97_04835 [Candidatus Nanoarchaeia archaeon]|nr:hypothetical protein [Candidatus Nanoarchaeia archaeon]
MNRPDSIKRFIGVASNTITHKILVKSELKEELRVYYQNEISRDVDIALAYRNNLNPLQENLPDKDAREIKKKVLLRVRAELMKRKDKGYTIDFSLIGEETEKFLRECKVQ